LPVPPPPPTTPPIPPGAGSVFEALRLDREVLVVVNESLQGNHQLELAKAVGDSGWWGTGFGWCVPVDLPATLCRGVEAAGSLPTGGGGCYGGEPPPRFEDGVRGGEGEGGGALGGTGACLRVFMSLPVVMNVRVCARLWPRAVVWGCVRLLHWHRPCVGACSRGMTPARHVPVCGACRVRPEGPGPPRRLLEWPRGVVPVCHACGCGGPWAPWR
jgi:hypothetical protein